MLIFFSNSRITGSSSTAFIFSASVMKYGRQIAAVDAHPFDHLHHRLGPLGFLDRCRPLRANLFERVGNGLADTAVVVSRDRGDLDPLFVVGHGSRELLQLSDDGVERAIEAALQSRSRWRRRQYFARLRENIAAASSVDVVVPSPTTSPVRSAACRMTWAPRFSS